jgi:hypothetical protein
VDICGLFKRINCFLHNPSKPSALKKQYQVLPQSNKYFLTSFFDDTLLSFDIDSFTLSVMSFLFWKERLLKL